MNDGKECIDNIEGMIWDLGLESTSRINDRKLRVVVQPRQGVRYTVYFLEFSGRVFIEAIVFKSISGDSDGVKLFYETLLNYSSSVFPFSFAMPTVQDGSMQIILKYSPSCGAIDAIELKLVIDALNEAFSIHIPRIKELADEYELTFTGHDDFNIRGIVRGILGF